MQAFQGMMKQIAHVAWKTGMLVFLAALEWWLYCKV